MTDPTGQPYPQPEPGNLAPPPPPPPPGMFAQPSGQQPLPPSGSVPPSAQAPRPKRRTGLIVGVVIVLLALCGLGACVLGIGLFSKGSETAIIDKAEQHVSAAMKDVEDAAGSLKKASEGSPAEIKDAVVSANKQLRDGRDQIAMATASADQLKDSQGKTDYMNSLKAATATLDALQDLVVYLDTASGMAGKASQAGGLARAANKALDSAIKSGNSSSYSAMRTQAVSASTNYTKAALLFREAHAMDSSAGLDKAAIYAEKRKLQADIIVRMADEGKAGRLSAYNSDIKKEEAFGRQAEAAGTPAIVSDPNWTTKRLVDLSAKIDAAAKQSDDLRAQALRELGYTK